MADNIAEILLPVPIWSTFSYEIPTEMQNMLQIGTRVLVNFGKKKFYTGLVVNICEKKSEDYELKPIYASIDNDFFVNSKQLELWNWISKYYCCSLGSVFEAAIPSILIPTSETKYNLIEEDYEQVEKLSNNEHKIIDTLKQNKESNINLIISNTGIKNPLPCLQKLIDNGIVSNEQKLKKLYKAQEYNYVSYCILDLDKNKDSYDKIINKNSKQAEILKYLELQRQISDCDLIELEEKCILKKCSASKSSLKSLEKQGLIKLFRQTKGFIEEEYKEIKIVLTAEQSRALREAEAAFNQNMPVLLHGVTSSGKTEIYVKLIQKAISEKKKVLYLLPEIALTSQIINRLQKYFGNRIAVYHSKYSVIERCKIYEGILNNKYDIILGVRSAILLPFDNLGLIIVDEEHENSYKQFDPDPRYNARDVALVLSKIHKSNIILGSATPSIESYNNAQKGRYKLVELFQRYGNVNLPIIKIADMQDAYRRKINKGYFHPILLSEMQNTLNKGEQIILFQNRRGYSSITECKDCGWVPHCTNCNVSLTYHKYVNKLSCHYCGEKYNPPIKCGNCGSLNLSSKGLGTEKIEESVQAFFPEARIDRLDYDTASSRKNYERIINEFENGEIDILIGTQMITKGLDFPNVSLVGILNADNMLNFPEFRAFERAFQLLSQVSGRAGRRDKQGKVIVQTFTPDHQIINQVVNGDYQGMFNRQMEERSLFHYPPLWNYIIVKLKHKDDTKSKQAAQIFAQELAKILYERVRGPEEPLINRISNYFIMNIHIRYEKNVSSQMVKNLILEKIQFIKAIPNFSQIVAEVDVDPY